MSSRERPLEFLVKQLQVNDCPRVRQMFTRAGLNLHKYLAEIVLGVDQGATFVAEDISRGILIGICSGVNLSPSLAHFGLFGVLPEYRGKGVGTALSDKVMEHIGSQRNITLYSSPTMVNKYEAKGFTVEPNVNLQVFRGNVNADTRDQLVKAIDNISVAPINDQTIEKVIEYDRQIGPDIDRKSLIEGLSRSNDTLVMVAMNDGEEVVGYCVAYSVTKPGGSSLVRVEQNYANNGSIAELLLAHSLRSFAGNSPIVLMLECYQSNQYFIELLVKRLGLEFLRSEPLLYSKQMIKVHYDKIFNPSFNTTYPY